MIVDLETYEMDVVIEGVSALISDYETPTRSMLRERIVLGKLKKARVRVKEFDVTYRRPDEGDGPDDSRVHRIEGDDLQDALSAARIDGFLANCEIIRVELVTT